MRRWSRPTGDELGLQQRCLVAAVAVSAALLAVLSAVFAATSGDSGDLRSAPGWASALGVRSRDRSCCRSPRSAVAVALALAGRRAEAVFLLAAVVGAGVLTYVLKVILQVLGADQDGGAAGRLPERARGRGHGAGPGAGRAGMAAQLAASCPRAPGDRRARSCRAGGLEPCRGRRAHGPRRRGRGRARDRLGGRLPARIAAAPCDWVTSHRLLLAGACACAVVLFVVLAATRTTRVAVVAEVDTRTARWVASSMPAWAEWTARPFTWLGGGLLLAALALGVAAVLWHRHAPGDAVLLVGDLGRRQPRSSGCSRPVSTGPVPTLGSAIPLPSSPSFPSGHAAGGVAVLGALGVLAAARSSAPRARAAWVAAGLLLGVAVGASRVALGVHYVSDVLAGYCVGVVVLCAALLARDRRGGAHRRQPVRSPGDRDRTADARPAARGARSPARLGS